MARDDKAAQSAGSGWPLTTEEKERFRLVVAGQRADDGARAHRVLGVYHHGFTKFAIRLPRTEAVKMARAILDGVG